MGSAFNKEIARSITQSAGRFIAIAIISLLGAGCYAGLRMAAPDMRIAGDEFFDATSMYDISVVSTLGLDDDSVKALEALDGVGAVMPAYRADAMVRCGEGSYAANIESLSASAQSSDTSDGVHARSDDDGYLNRPILVEGSWPMTPRECVIDYNAREGLGLAVGDSLSVEKTIGDVDDTFAETSFTVVGFVNAPAFISSAQLGTTSLGTGSIELFLYVEEAAFKADVPFTVAYVEVPAAHGTTWDTEAYDEAVAPVKAEVERAADGIARQRWDTVVGDAQRELDDARAEYERERADAQTKLDDAADELARARTEMADGSTELDNASFQLADAWRQLEESERTLEASEADYEQGLAQLEAQRRELAPALEQLPALRRQYAALEQQQGVPPEQLAALRAQIEQIEAGAAALDAAQVQLDGARSQLDEGWEQLADGRAEYESGLNDYLIGREEYEQGVADLEEGQAEYEANKAEADEKFADAEADLAEAQADIDDIEYPEVYVLDRSKNPGAASLSSDADGIAQIATFLPFMFFLVAALVSLTSMTRMVDEERLEIGTHKALGYGKARITSKYLVYGALASGVGAGIGIVLLGKLLPWFILTSYAISYDVPVFPLPLEPVTTLKALGLSVGVTLVATWGAAAASLREKPASLMLPRVPKAGKRIFLERIRPLWSRLSFSHKVTARNLLRYKRRFFMAVVGVAGCTALLMVGFGLRDAIGDIVTKQYGDLLRYDAAVRLADDITPENRSRVEKLLGDSPVESYQLVEDFNMVAAGPDGDMRVEVVVPESTAVFGSFITLRDRASGEGLACADDQIILTEKAARVLGLRVGDTVTLYDENDVGDATGDGRSFTVGGITENYLGHYAYLLPQGYRAAFGEEPSFDMAYVQLAPDADAAQFGDALLAIEGVSTVSFMADRIAQYEDMLDVMNKLIYVIMGLSAALAFVVLYNLTNINITERVREIATLKVLGFTKGEVNAYIFREIAVMALIGALIGCVGGVPLTFYIAEAAETANMMFGRTIEPASYVLSFAITIAFAAIVSLAMRRKLAHVNMVESLKSIE